MLIFTLMTKPIMSKISFEVIYIPMTADILHAGHIKSLRWLDEQCDFLVVGLITDEGLKGYKKPIMPYKDRKIILDELRCVHKVVPQNSLSPEENIKKYRPDAIASGDGWEPAELSVIKKYKLKVIDIENGPWKRYSSTAIKKKICQNYC